MRDSRGGKQNIVLRRSEDSTDDLIAIEFAVNRARRTRRESLSLRQ